MKPPIDLDKLYADFVATIGSDRGDEHRLHGSDLGGCDYATHLRLKGEPRLPFDDESIHRFYRGHMVEKFVSGALTKHSEEGWEVVLGEVVEHKGLVGHLDIRIIDSLFKGWVIDVSTTGNQKAPPSYSHVLKTAFYADAHDYDRFCEWVFPANYRGHIGKPNAYWFETKNFTSIIDARVKVLQALEFGEFVPEMRPPVQMKWLGEGASPTGFVPDTSGGLKLEVWRCEKYCNAICPKNQLVTAEILAEMVPF